MSQRPPACSDAPDAPDAPDAFGASFARVYREHAPMVRTALCRLGVATASLDDAMQDVFVVLHRRAAHYDHDRSLKNWLWGIARGVASTYRRSDRRRHRLIGALPRERTTRPIEGDVARGEAARILDTFLGTLDADKCAVFMLSEVEGRSGPEISRMLDVNVNTVYARLRAARRHFASAVQEHRDPSARPLFAAWLPSIWLPRLASVAAGAGALVTALSLPMQPETIDAVEPTLARAMIPDEPVVDVAPDEAVVPPVARTHRPEPIPLAMEEIEIIDDPPPPPRRRRVRSSPPGAEPVVVAEPTPAAAPVTELVAPPQRPWGEHIVARAPTTAAAPLVTPRVDFVDELLDVTRGL